VKRLKPSFFDNILSVKARKGPSVHTGRVDKMNDSEKMKLVDTLFMIHEGFGVDGFTSFEIGHESKLDENRVQDDWGIVYLRNPHGLPVAKGHPVKAAGDLTHFDAPEPAREHLLIHSIRESIQTTASPCLRPPKNMDYMRKSLVMNHAASQDPGAVDSSAYYAFTLLFLLYMFDYFFLLSFKYIDFEGPSPTALSSIWNKFVAAASSPNFL
jgi:hypothetical protein